MTPQSGILAPPPPIARFLTFEVVPGVDSTDLLEALASLEVAEDLLVGLGQSRHPFEAQLRRMVGLDDGITDARFRFTKPVSGGYYWCPPVLDDHLDLRALEM